MKPHIYPMKPLLRTRFPTYLFLAITIVATTILRLSNLHAVFAPSPPPAPPPLNPLLSHLSRANPPPPRDWKRPYVLTSYGARQSDGSLHLTVFTAGILLGQFGRQFNAVACVVGKHVFNAISAEHEKVNCIVPPHVKLQGTVSVLLRHDQRLKNAISEPQTLYSNTFRIEQGDVFRVDLPLSERVRERLKGSDAMQVASDLQWGDHLEDEPLRPEMARYQLCMMTSMKQYPYLLPGWIDFYKRLGVDQFYIYDNHAEKDLSNLRSQFVQTVYWPYARSQTQIFTHFTLAGRRRCKFVAFLDADEYILVGGRGKELLKQYVMHKARQGYTQIMFLFYRMWNNGYVRRPQGAVPELYTKTMKEQRIEKGKIILDMDAGWKCNRVHAAKGGRDVKYFNRTVELDPRSVEDNAMLIHYSSRSWEEYVMKQNVGSASVLAKERHAHSYKVDEPLEWYMKSDGPTWLGMRNFHRKVMQMSRGESAIVWQAGKEVCSTRICAGCWRARPIVCR